LQTDPTAGLSSKEITVQALVETLGTPGDVALRAGHDPPDPERILLTTSTFDRTDSPC